MRELEPKLQEELRQMFGRFVTFDPFERRFYRSDVGVMPSLVSPLIGNLMPAGVVKPLSEAKVVELVRFARQHRIPLVPRGKASSGYGGVLPVAGGLVVDLSWLTQIESIDLEGQTATVGAGVVWETLEKELNQRGLALCTYPSSAPSSTVGGWLAQGGMGYGAFAYGPFRSTVVSARVVLPTGEVRTFAGDELDLISDAEGITGFITAVTLRVRKWEPEAVWAARFSSARDMARVVQELHKEKLPLWSVSFITPQMAEMKNNLPPKIEHGHVVEEERPKLPAGYILVMVAAESGRPAVEGKLVELVRAAGGELLDEALAQHEWAERFNILHVKRLGPSLVPAEVLVPAEGLGGMLAGVEQRIQLPIAIEGLVSGTGDVTLLGFILHDQRKFTFNFAYALSLSMLKLAKENGGRAYSTGLYFAKEAPNVLGAPRLEKLRAFKAQVDPQNLFNPNKVLDGKPLLSTFMSLAEAFEPLIRPFGNAAKNPVGEHIAGAGRRGIPDDVAWYAYTCAQCGYCVDQCDQYYGREWESQSPRGKWRFLREYMEGKVDWNRKMDEAVLACTTCEMCNVRCPLELPIESSWLKLRGRLVYEEGHMTFPPFEVMRASLRKEHNIWGALREKRASWVPEDKIGMLPERAEIAYFPGCTASYVEQDIAQATACLLHKAGIEFTYLGEDEACCGIPMLVAGLWDTWEEIMRHNIQAMKARGVKTIVTSCPACWLSWHTYYPQWCEKLGIEYDFQVKHYSEILVDKIASGELALEHEIPATVTWHDSCHMGRAGGIYEEPRQLI
ncbi:MAG: FAD-binding and (Fe-S)-binding domain-containing protein, partial [Anaerolineae bacterium]